MRANGERKQSHGTEGMVFILKIITNICTNKLESKIRSKYKTITN